MGLTQSFFSLSDQQLEKINAYIADRAAQYGAAGEDPPQEVRIEFSWTIYGRCIDVFFNGEIHGFPIECAWEGVVEADSLQGQQEPKRRKV